MNTTRSETRRVSRSRPASMLRNVRREAMNLVQRAHSNWHLMASPVHGKLWACPSVPFAGGVLP